MNDYTHTRGPWEVSADTFEEDWDIVDRTGCYWDAIAADRDLEAAGAPSDEEMAARLLYGSPPPPTCWRLWKTYCR